MYPDRGYSTKSLIVAGLHSRSTADDLGDLLGDCTLAGAVILQLERVNHIGGALGGGIHGGHAGALLGAEALGHGTKDHAVHIDGGRLLEHRPGIREHLHLAAGVAQTLGRRREVGTVQRQQAFHDRLAGQRVLDLGVDDVDLVQLAGLEIIDGIHRDITVDAIDDFKSGKLDEIYIVYTKIQNALTSEPVMERLLPLDRAHLTPAPKGLGDPRGEVEMFPDAWTVFEQTAPIYMHGMIFGAMTESFCAEQSARMTAMDSATKSATDMIHALQLEYNRTRQGAITQEITEIIGGASAVQTSDY